MRSELLWEPVHATRTKRERGILLDRKRLIWLNHERVILTKRNVVGSG